MTYPPLCRDLMEDVADDIAEFSPSHNVRNNTRTHFSSARRIKPTFCKTLDTPSERINPRSRSAGDSAHINLRINEVSLLVARLFHI
jgi:hypothetical protein